MKVKSDKRKIYITEEKLQNWKSENSDKIKINKNEIKYEDTIVKEGNPEQLPIPLNNLVVDNKSLYFKNKTFAKGVDLSNMTHIGNLVFEDCIFQGSFNAEQCDIKGSVSFLGKTFIKGSLQFREARISGSVTLSCLRDSSIGIDSNLSGNDSVSFIGARIGGSVKIKGKLKTASSFGFENVTIDSNLVIKGEKFTSENTDSSKNTKPDYGIIDIGSTGTKNDSVEIEYYSIFLSNGKAKTISILNVQASHRLLLEGVNATDLTLNNIYVKPQGETKEEIFDISLATSQVSLLKVRNVNIGYPLNLRASKILGDLYLENVSYRRGFRHKDAEGTYTSESVDCRYMNVSGIMEILGGDNKSSLLESVIERDKTQSDDAEGQEPDKKSIYTRDIYAACSKEKDAASSEVVVATYNLKGAKVEIFKIAHDVKEGRSPILIIGSGTSIQSFDGNSDHLKKLYTIEENERTEYLSRFVFPVLISGIMAVCFSQIVDKPHLFVVITGMILMTLILTWGLTLKFSKPYKNSRKRNLFKFAYRADWKFSSPEAKKADRISVSMHSFIERFWRRNGDHQAADYARLSLLEAEAKKSRLNLIAKLKFLAFGFSLETNPLRLLCLLFFFYIGMLLLVSQQGALISKEKSTSVVDNNVTKHSVTSFFSLQIVNTSPETILINYNNKSNNIELERRMLFALAAIVPPAKVHNDFSFKVTNNCCLGSITYNDTFSIFRLIGWLVWGFVAATLLQAFKVRRIDG